MQIHPAPDDFHASATLIRSSFKRLFETLLEQTADRIYIKDTQGRFIFASDALARIHGLKDRSELEGMSDFDIFDQDTAQSFHDREQISAHLKNGFITGLDGHFGEVQPDGCRHLHVSHCGHPHLLVLRIETGQAEVIKLPNAMVMGLPGGSAAATVQVPLHSGDRVYTFTDGIIEASDATGLEFGLDRIAQSVQASVGLTLQQSLDRLFEQVAQFTGSSDQQDDISLLAFEVE